MEDKMSAASWPSESSPPAAARSAPYPSPAPPQGPLPENYEYDFVEEPPKDFYCAVSLELLLDPQQSDCCGHHFTWEVVEHLKMSGKPCPMCKEQFTTHADKYHKRRVCEVSVRCLHKATGECAWVGELGNIVDHVTSCPKRPWRCTYCGFAGLKEAESEHNSTCEMFPVDCPNNCEVRTVPRSQLDQHKLECLLEEVSCEYASLGCSKRLPRRDLPGHLEEGEKEHLLKMCALNIGLTQQLVQRVEERDNQIAQLQLQLLAMEDKLKQSVEKVEGSGNSRVLEVERRLESEVRGIKELVSSSVSSVDRSISSVRSSLVDIQQQVDAISCIIPPKEFVVTNFAALKYHKLEWRSPPFYSHHGGYKMCIGVFPHGLHKGCGTHVSLRFYKMRDLNSDSLPWDIGLQLRVQVQNQSTKTWEKEYTDNGIRSKPDGTCVGSSAEYNYLRNSELSSYVRNDQLHIRVTDFSVVQATVTAFIIHSQ